MKWVVSIGLCVLMLAVAGCGLLHGRRAGQEVRIGSLVLTNTPEGKATALEVLQSEVTRFADKYAVTVAEAVDEYTRQAASPEGRLEAVRWKLGQGTAAWVDASGPNPVLNMLDLTVLAIMSRMVLEEEVSRFLGPEGGPLLEAHRRLETNIWSSVGGLLSADQREQLLEMIEDWRRRNPGQRYAAVTRFRELAAAVGRAPAPGKSGPRSILSLLFLDPLAGLDPTAAAIQETRHLGERAMYYSQRMPTLLNWQMQLLTLQLGAQPESKRILTNADRLTRATETFAKVAEQLPQVVNEQREAAIRQMLEGVAAERTNLLAGLAVEEQKARALLVEARETLDAGSGMAVSVQATIKTLDEFVRLISAATNRAAASGGKPFDVVEYGQTAERVEAMARELQRLLAGVKETTPELGRLRQEATVDLQRVVRQAFGFGLALILILLAGAVAAGLVYRALAHRWWGKGARPAAGLPGGDET